MLPAIIKKFFSPTVILRPENETALVMAQAKALAEVGAAMKDIAEFITGHGLQESIKASAKYGAVNSILNGLTVEAGRAGLDARTINQDAVEIVHKVEAVHDKYESHLKEKVEGRDPDIHDAELDFKKFMEMNDE